MNGKEAQVEIVGERMLLLPQRAVFWQSRRTLIIADCHWGKDASFRAAGIAVPGSVQNAELDRLSGLLNATQAERLLILGDLLHAPDARRPTTRSQVTAWRNQFTQLQIVLIEGNHDRRSGIVPAEWHIAYHRGELNEPPFVWRHEPGISAAGYVLCGHIHPKVRLTGAGQQAVDLPCFWIGPGELVLPAFSHFTSGQRIRVKPDDQVYVIADGHVIAVAK